MKKLEGNKLVALLLSAGMATSLLAACSVNTDQLGQGISDLGNAFNTTATQAPSVSSAPESSETAVSSSAQPTEKPEEKRIIHFANRRDWRNEPVVLKYKNMTWEEVLRKKG